MNNLGWKYHNGIGVEQSDDKAKEYYARAIEIDKTALEPKQNLTFLEDQETKIKEQGYTIRRNIVQWYDQERGKALGKRLEKKYKDIITKTDGKVIKVEKWGLLSFAKKIKA